MIVFVDVGGTKTSVWSDSFKRKFPTDLAHLPKKLKIAGATALVIGLRGVWTNTEKNAWKKRLRGLAPRIEVLSDIELAHRLAFGKGPGIVLNAGTGSIAFGRNNAGKTTRAGGLGALLGDEGSAFWIGCEYLKHAYREDGNINEIRNFAINPQAVPKIAGVAKTVLRTAEREPKSTEAAIVQQAQQHLWRLIEDVRKKLKLPAGTPVHLTGGLFENRFFSRQWKKFHNRASPS